MSDSPPTMNQKDTSRSRILPSHLPTLLRARDVAALLAISVRCVWRLAASGDLPRPIRLGGSTRWRAHELEEFIARGAANRAKRDIPRR
ncbi:MAG: helix-turn-helix domain-containing protein [Phycisphaerales bacterium]|jgi:predicted DNA-binding transcriptional regulator AlpA|nr:helix-turn-helix domain-containing protein [Phycisphaerales bacterium]